MREAKKHHPGRRLLLATIASAGSVFVPGPIAALASNHLDTAAVTANPQANIGDLFAWMSPDGHRLNLVMDIVGRSFSDKLQYTFHIDSGEGFGRTTASTTIACRFPRPEIADCRLDDRDRAYGNAQGPDGIGSRHHRFRVFAGRRDDPFFNNVKGTRAAYQVAFAAMKHGVDRDPAGCPVFAPATAHSILHQWRHTDGGAATNFLAHWTASALVVSVDRDAVARGGNLLAVWATTRTSVRQLDRMGRPLSKNALLGLTDEEDVDDLLKTVWNEATPTTSQSFVPEVEKELAFYDGLDGTCGNQFLAKPGPAAVSRYKPLARLLVDDRLWVNAASGHCTQLFAVELASLSGQARLKNDCGGRMPTYDASNIWRSLMVAGRTEGVDDGLDHDEHIPPVARFPFLAPPDLRAIDH